MSFVKLIRFIKHVIHCFSAIYVFFFKLFILSHKCLDKINKLLMLRDKSFWRESIVCGTIF